MTGVAKRYEGRYWNGVKWCDLIRTDDRAHAFRVVNLEKVARKVEHVRIYDHIEQKFIRST